MRLFNRFLFLLMFVSTAAAQGVTGLWDGAAQVTDARWFAGTITVPVHLDISGSGDHVVGAFINGAARSDPSTEGLASSNSITLKFAHSATILNATLQDGVLKGTYSGDDGSFAYPFELRLHVNQNPSKVTAPDISGEWIVPAESSKGEHAFRLVLKQTGPNVSGTILRVDGDMGTLAGTYQDGKFVLSHFGDVRASILEIIPSTDGSLDLTIYGTHTHVEGLRSTDAHDAKSGKLTAFRATVAQAKHMPQPDDFSAHTSVKDLKQPLKFSFPDLNGRIVSNTDPQFKGKVVLVNITGSWCPNCHDEAPFLAELYRKYRSRGVEIVALDFEYEPAQLKSLARLHAFIKQYGIEYTYLIAGSAQEVNEKLPQAVNLNAWPTTFFIGKDGLVHAVETGFTSAASAEFDKGVRAKYVANIENLLAEKAGASSN